MRARHQPGEHVSADRRIAKLFDFDTSQVIGITRGDLTVFYRLERIDSDLGGAAFRLEKAIDGSGKEPDVYRVLLHGANTSCDCAVHSFTGHCKHADALAALIGAGKL